MNKPLTTEELNSLIEKNGEVEVYIESNRNKWNEGWVKLTSDKNIKLNSYKRVDSNKYFVRRLSNIYWRAWLNKPTEKEKESFCWKEKDNIEIPIPCPFCDIGQPMDIKIDRFLEFYEGSAKCSNCNKKIKLNGVLFSVDEVYQEIYRICDDF